MLLLSHPEGLFFSIHGGLLGQLMKYKDSLHKKEWNFNHKPISYYLGNLRQITQIFWSLISLPPVSG